MHRLCHLQLHPSVIMVVIRSEPIQTTSLVMLSNLDLNNGKKKDRSHFTKAANDNNMAKTNDDNGNNGGGSSNNDDGSCTNDNDGSGSNDDDGSGTNNDNGDRTEAANEVDTTSDV